MTYIWNALFVIGWPERIKTGILLLPTCKLIDPSNETYNSPSSI